jgi:hypothetical protein
MYNLSVISTFNLNLDFDTDYSCELYVDIIPESPKKQRRVLWQIEPDEILRNKNYIISSSDRFDLILTTLLDLIEEKKIKSLFIETHSDKAMIYENANNSFSNFKNILEKNYKIKFFSFDGKFVHPNDLSLYEGVSAMEWDSYWELK